MASIPALDHLPAEISERISEHLDLVDLFSLRLTSRRVCSAASQKSFTKHFWKKTKSLSNTSDLQRLSESVRQSEHARKLQHLDFCITEEKPQDSTGMDSTVHAVTAVLATLRQHLAEGCLQRLSIRLHDNGELRNWERAWEIVGGGWTALIRSLAASGLAINELDAFTKSFGSISLDRFYPCVSSAALAGCFNCLQSLDLSLSHSLEDILDLDNSPDDLSDDSLGDALEESSRMYLMTIDPPKSAPLSEQQDFLKYVVRQCAVPNLQSVTLRGVHTFQAVLLRLAEKSQLRSVEMDNTYMEGNDTFRPFFDCITPNLDTVKLSDLWEVKVIDFEFAEPPEIRNEYIREGHSARQPIAYHQSRIIPSGEIEVVMKMRKRHLNYGPPKKNV